MRVSSPSLMAAVVVTVGGLAQPLEQGIAARAAATLGGMARIQAVKTLVVDGTGDTYELGQGPTIDGEMFQWRVDQYRRLTDFAAGRWREESLQTPSYRTRSYRLVHAYADGLAFDEDTGHARRQSDAVAANRRASLYHHPIGFLQAIDDDGAKLENARHEGGYETVDLVLANGQRYALVVRVEDGLPVRVVSKGHEPALGDVEVSTEFRAYVDVDGLKLPGRVTTSVDGGVIADIRLTGMSINGLVPALEAPQDARVPAESLYTVAITEAAPGVWYLAGDNHHSVVVEFARHLTLIEAPGDEGRTLAVIAAARRLRPGKPLTEVINTHHHFDHAAGIRAAIAEGLTVITHEGNRAFFERVATRPSTVVRDALARNPRPLQIETVSAPLIKADALRRMEIYPITASPHATAFLMVYLPAERLLVEADAYQPAPLSATQPGLHPFARNLLDNIEARDLRIDRVLPLHGRIVPFADLVMAARGSHP